MTEKRHIACTKCRERKVRCDGKRPNCERCLTQDVECVYRSPPPGRTASSGTGGTTEDFFMGVSTQTMQDEDGNNTNPSSESDDPFSSQGPSSAASSLGDGLQLSSGDMDTAMLSVEDILSSQAYTDSFLHNTVPPASLETAPYLMFPLDVQEHGHDHLDMTNQLLDDERVIKSENFPTVHTEPLTMASMAPMDLEIIQEELLDELCRYYFETVHHTLPMLDEKTFSHVEAESPQTNDALVIRWAMYAHVANSSPRFTTCVRASHITSSDQDHSNWFYLKARNHIELAALNEGATSPSLRMLQAMVLVAFYELRTARFSRAWTTISHATWLAQMLQLASLDSQHASEQRDISASLQYPTNRSDADEARRTLWAVLTLNSFIGVGVSWNVVSALESSEISTFIPRGDGIIQQEPSTLRLSDALKRSSSGSLSIYQSMTITTSLCAHVIAHVKSMSREDPLGQFGYNFWTQHYRLDGIIKYITDSIPNKLSATDQNSSDTHIILNLMLKALSTCLHQAVIQTARTKKGSDPAQVQASVTACIENSIHTARVLQLNYSTETMQTNLFLPWTIYVALQALVRQLNGSNGENLLHVSSLASKQDPVTSQSTTSHYIDQTTYNPAFSDDAWTDVSARDSISTLQFMLRTLSNKSQLARVFHEQIEQEIEGAVDLTTRPVGIASFLTPSFS